MRKLALLLASAILLGSAAGPCSPAFAASPKKQMTFAQRAEAKRLFDQAHLSYERGRYEEAILKWEKSYELSGEPLIFDSISNAYERLGDTKQAREYLAKWRAEAPPAEYAALDERLASLDTRIAEEEGKARSESERRQREQQELDRERARIAQARQQSQGGADSAQAGAGSSPLLIPGAVLTAVGGAAVLTGIILDAVAGSSRPDAATACVSASAGQLCKASERDSIEKSNRLAVAGDVTWIAGSALTVTGVALLLADLLGSGPEAAPAAAPGAKPAAAPQARIVPWIGPTQTGLTIVGRF